MFYYKSIDKIFITLAGKHTYIDHIVGTDVIMITRKY